MPEMKIREAWITYNGVRIFAFDWTDATNEEVSVSLQRSTNILVREKEKTLCIANVTGAGWGIPLLDIIRTYIKTHKATISRFAITGMPAAYMSSAAMARDLSNAPIPLFASWEQALRYLTRSTQRKGGA